MHSPHPVPHPRTVVRRTLSLGIGALVIAGLLAWTPTAASGWNQGAAEGTLWQLLNGARVNNGMAPLQQHSTLVGLARWRSSDMLAKDYFSHTIAGCGCLVYAYYDSNGLDYVWGGENIGWNSGRTDEESPVRVHEQFMGSSGHRANVLNPAFTHGGVGAAAADNQKFQGYVQNTRMYTELFLQAHASAPAPAPAPAAPAPPAGGSAAAPAQPAAQPAAASAAPKPRLVRMDRPQRPTSAAGLDGRTVVVSEPNRFDLAARLTLEETAAVRAARLAATVAAATGPAGDDLEVQPTAQEPSVLDGIVGAVIAFLFG